MGIGPVHFLPPRRATDLPRGRARTRGCCWRSPSWPTPRARWKSAARRWLPAPFPLGAEGTTAWLQAAADAFGVAADALRARRPRAAARARRRRDRPAPRPARRQARVLLPRQPARDPARPLPRRASSACSWPKSARPICTASTWPPSWRCCRPAPRSARARTWSGSSTAAAAARPDIVVCGLGLANPLEAEGIDHQMVDRAAVHADPGLRPGRRPGRTVRPPAGAARRGCGSSAMQLTLWTYEGPPHVGAMRDRHRDGGRALRAARAAGRHLRRPAVHHDRAAPKRPPVTYTTFQARDLGGDTAELFKTAARDAYARFQPQALLVGASCTAELIQDDPGGLARALGLPIPVVALELPAYQKKENWGAAETFYQLVRAFAGPHAPPPGTQAGAGAALQRARPGGARLPPPRRRGARSPACSARMGIEVNVVGPARRDAGRPGPARRRRVQRGAVSGDRRPGGRAGCSAPSASRPRKTVPIGVGATARLHRRGRRRWPASMPAPALARDVAPALVLALGRQQLPHRQAGVRVRRRDPRDRRGPGRRRGVRLHRRRPRHLQPRVRPRGARRAPSATASRR